MLKIAVLVKNVPNRGGNPPEISEEDFRLRREQPEAGLDPSDEPGVELAVQLAGPSGGEVTVVSMGTEAALPALHRALAMGADRAVLVTDDELAGADVLTTAKVLAAVIGREPFDLIVAGAESTDAATGTMPMALGALLELPSATFARRVTLDGRRLSIERQTAAGYDDVECELPALVGVTQAVADPRYPTLRETIRAKSKPVERVSLIDLGLSPDQLRSTHMITSIDLAAERQAGEVIEDADEGVARIVALLREMKVK